MRIITRKLCGAALALTLIGCNVSGAADTAQSDTADATGDVSGDVRALHESLLTLDSHLDTPMHFGRVDWDISERHTEADDGTHLDIPRMKEGGLDGGFFVIYSPQGELTETGYEASFSDAVKRSALIRQTVVRNPDALMLALTSADARAAEAAGKRAVFQSIENSYPLGEDLSRLELFHDLGVRMAGPVHSRDNQFADSATGDGKWGGLSPMGREWVAEMNRLGMVIDGSHSSDAAFDELIALSKTPLVLSHSGVKAVFDHPRNIDDERLRTLAANGGVILMNSIFLGPLDWDDELGEVLDRMDNIEDIGPEEQRALIAERTRLLAAHPPRADSFDDFMRALLHAIDIAGVDHVGIGADWDGGGGVAGMEDVSRLARITAALKDAGHSDEDIAKIWSGNLLRVLDAAQAGAG